MDLEAPGPFEEACHFVRENRGVHVSGSDKRNLYVLYKVATVGSVPTGPRPFLAEKARYWDAWKERGGGMDAATAKARYVALVEKLKAAHV